MQDRDLQRTTPETDAPETLGAYDICRCCGYELDGIRIDSVCPECGQPAAWSAGEDLLVNADPKLVMALKRGLPLLHAVLAGTGVCFLLIAHICWAIWIQSGGVMTQMRIAGVMILANALLFVLSVFVVTPEDPGADEDDRAIRTKTRRAACIAVVIGVAGGLVLMVGVPAAWGPIVVKYAPLLIALLTWWFLHDAITGVAQHVRATARRVPLHFDRSFRVASLAGWIVWLMIIPFFIRDRTVVFLLREVVIAAYFGAVVISIVNVERTRRGVARVAQEQARRERERTAAGAA